jgi:signal recognition particle subunit SRP54
MLDGMKRGLSDVIRKLVTGTAVDKKAVEEVLEEMKKILLQSDVDTKVLDELLSRIRKKCFDEKIPSGLTLREQVLKVIYEELVNLLGEKPAGLGSKKRIMLVGLFGCGKTTSSGKIARYLIKQGLKPALVGLDYHRPAATDQIKELAKQLGVSVYTNPKKDPFEGAMEALKKYEKYDSIIFDTAGRNALDGDLADELKKLGEIIKPDEVLLTIPADLGKVAKQQSEEFHKLVGITGVIITRMDGTAKAGGSLSATSITGAKVKFIGVGERLEDFEMYDPERFVSRLLGLGDLQTLLEKAKEAEIKPESVEKIVEGKFTLQDFYDQLQSMQKMGPMKQLLQMVPGGSMLKLPDTMIEKQEEKMKIFGIIIQSMTPKEKEDPNSVDASRIKRIAKGSGRSETEVRELINQYNQMKKMVRQFGGMKGLQRGEMKRVARQMGFGI